LVVKSTNVAKSPVPPLATNNVFDEPVEFAPSVVPRVVMDIEEAEVVVMFVEVA
jgi:hypothetical protein